MTIKLLIMKKIAITASIREFPMKQTKISFTTGLKKKERNAMIFEIPAIHPIFLKRKIYTLDYQKDRELLCKGKIPKPQ